ncbi:MAG: reverse transcriptase/maturase family protein, partial [Microgenomates group bacterium]
TRSIHKALVRDRLLHHAIHRILYPYFDKKFIYDSYSCRNGKGTHRAVNRLWGFGRKVSKNNTRTAWVLKCDVKKFFASIDQPVLKNILKKHIEDKDILWLLEQVIGSFQIGNESGVGLPLGNLTSQLLINVYMNEFDQFVKHVLKIKYYIRYADDFVILNADKNSLENLLPKVKFFLNQRLKLTLHPSKVSVKSLASGVDFLGWIQFPNHRVLRTTTKRRMLRCWNQNQTEETYNSYLGLMRHGNTQKLSEMLTKDYLLLSKVKRKPLTSRNS